jgi:DNA-3-methyladenine glycosylase II
MPDRYLPASEFLASIDDDWRRHIAAIGPCLHQPHSARDPYESLVRAIAYQQLHAKAGDAILGRLLALFASTAFPRPQQILATGFDQLRSCGFSASKIATIQGIAQATLDGVVPDYATALAMDDEALIERLITLRGVGRWTVDGGDAADLQPGAAGYFASG